MSLARLPSDRHSFAGLALRVFAVLALAALLVVPVGHDAAQASHGDSDLPGVFRESTASWHLRDSLSGGAGSVNFHYGAPDDEPVMCDWTGDGEVTAGIVRARADGRWHWHLKFSNRGGVADQSFVYGRWDHDDVPVCGDWNNNDRETAGVVRALDNGRWQWHLRDVLGGGTPDRSFVYGRWDHDDEPVVGKWLGGPTVPGVVRALDNGRWQWHLRNSNTGGNPNTNFVYGRWDLDDVPIVGDWNANGRDGPGVTRALGNGRWNWLLRDTQTGGGANHDFVYGRWDAGDIPVVWHEATPPPPDDVADDIALAPQEATNPVNSTHELTATVTLEGQPSSGVQVRFEVSGTHTETGSATTGADGQAGFEYTGSQLGEDTIVACANADGSLPASCATADFSDDASKTWEAVPVDDLELEPHRSTNEVGETHELTATTFDDDDEPLQFAAVRFEVTGDHEETGSAVTDANGEARFSYTGTVTGEDDILACTNPDGTLPEDCDDEDNDIIVDDARKRWVDEITGDDLDLEPRESTNPVNSTHELTATVELDDQPAEGAEVRFEVSGTHDDTGTAVTDEDGEATFAYTGTALGEDEIVACTNADGSLPEDCDDADLDDDAEKTWEPVDAAALSLEPDDVTNPVGESHEVTATVTDGEGQPTEFAAVRFEVSGTHEETGSAVTDETGEASFDYEGVEAGEDTIVACTNEDGTLPDDCADADEVRTDTATKLWEERAADSLALAPEEARNFIGGDHTLVATVTDQFEDGFADAEVRFEVYDNGTLVAGGWETTDETGEAEFTYDGPEEPRIDGIIACANEDGSPPVDCVLASGPSDTATKTWIETDVLTLEPDDESNPVGESHEVTATVRDNHQEPAEGAQVRFEVSGTHEDTGTGVTDENGEATFSYTGTDVGSDDITACTNPDGSLPEDCEDTEVSDTATKEWSPLADALALTQEEDTNPVDEAHEVTATVTLGEDPSTPSAGVQVRFEVSGTHEATGDAVTDEDGEAHFEYTGTEAGDDEIVACANANGSLPDSCDEADFEDDATKTWEERAADSLALAPGMAVNVVGDTHEVTATVLDQFDDPFQGAEVRFEVWENGVFVPPPGEGTTDEEGRAEFSYSHEDAAEHEIVACTHPDGALPFSCAEAGVVSDDATKTWADGVVDNLTTDARYTSIQAAVDEASADDELRARGEFDENVTIGVQGVTLFADEEGDATLREGDASAIILRVTASDVTIHNLHFESAGGQEAVRLLGARGTVTGSVFEGPGGAPRPSRQVAIGIRGADAEVEGNVFSGYFHGIRHEGGAMTVTGNHFEDNITGWNSFGGGAGGNTVTDNTFTGNSSGVVLATPNNEVGANHFEDNGTGVQFWGQNLDTSSNVVSDNDFVENNFGIRLQGGDGNVKYEGSEARHNRFVGNAVFGVSNARTEEPPPFDAAENWWGDEDGPSDEGPGEDGDAVGANVDFAPWCLDADCSTLSTNNDTNG
jgi:parallel beta-helix repeat protein